MIATDRALSVLPLAALFPLENERPTSEQRSNATATNHLAYQAVASTAATSRTLQMGRFVSVEPTWFGAPEAPSSWNRYTYAGNNPVIARDPDGQIAIPIAVGIVLGAGVLKGAENVVESYAEHGNFEGAGKEFTVGFVSGGLGAAAGFISKSPYIGGAVTGGLTEALNEVGHGGVQWETVAKASGIGFAGGGLVKFLGPRPGTFTGRLLTPRTLSVLLAGRNVTRQTFSPIIEGTAEALYGVYKGSRNANELGDPNGAAGRALDSLSLSAQQYRWSHDSYSVTTTGCFGTPDQCVGPR